MYKKALLLAGLFAFAVPASATVQFSFSPGAAASSIPGLTLLSDFDGTNPAIVSGNAQILSPPSTGSGAVPAYGSSGNFLSVLGGNTATIALDNVAAFAFDWGSLDSYNHLTIHSSTGDVILTPGVTPLPGAGSDGNQFQPGTNGALYVFGNAGETFSGFSLNSTSNSFEIDNVRIAAVPEPATWGMLILGIAAIGMSMRRRRTSVSFA